MTDGYACIQMPVETVFGSEDIIQNDEILFIERKAWGTAKMDKAVTIQRDGLMFKGFDRKGSPLGFVEAVTEIDGRFPDIEAVKPEEGSEIAFFGINSKLLQSVADVVGSNLFEFKAYDRGPFTVKVADSSKSNFVIDESINIVFQGVATQPSSGKPFTLVNSSTAVQTDTITPEEQGVDIDTSLETLAKLEGQITDLENQLEYSASQLASAIRFEEEAASLREELTRLKSENTGKVTAETGMGDLVYKADNLALAELMADFVEIIRTGNAKEIIETMKMLA